MEARHAPKNTFRTRGEYLVSLVPKMGNLSEAESNDEEVVDDDELEMKINTFFQTYPQVLEEDNFYFTDVCPDSGRTSNALDLFSDVTDEVIIDTNNNENERGFTLTNLKDIPKENKKKKETGKIKKSQNNKKKTRKYKQICKNTEFKWTKDPYLGSVSLPNEEDQASEEQTPLDYFEQFFTEELINLIVAESNTYSVQQTGKCCGISANDIREFLAVELHMGICRLPSFRDYWSSATRYEPVASIMSRNKYQKIRKFLHFCDNSSVTSDPYFKIRPVLEYIRKKFIDIDIGENKFAIDEMMVAYKGKRAGSKRQYMKNKPIKWGFKFYARSGPSGIVYDYFVYSGHNSFEGITFNKTDNTFGFSAKCVIALSKSIKNPKVKFLFFDNFFCSPSLMFYLRDHYGILSLGTIRTNRTEGAGEMLPSEKELKKMGRGSYAVVTDNDKNICVIKWFDNKEVLIGSSYVADEPVSSIERWNKVSRVKEKIKCPNIIRQYNSFMGGVDKSDMLVALYKTPLRTYKWYMAIFAHLIDMVVINSWLLYRRQQSKKQMRLKEFRLNVAQCIIHLRKVKRKKSIGSRSPTPPNSACQNARVPLFPNEIRLDQVGHFPLYSSKGKCRMCHKGQTTVVCKKCNVRLCFVPNRNCFLQFHSD